MTDKMPSRPKLDIRAALNDLLRRHDRNYNKEVGETYLGSEIFIARLRRPQVMEGEWEDLDRTIDLFDLIDAHQKGEGPGKFQSEKPQNCEGNTQSRSN